MQLILDHIRSLSQYQQLLTQLQTDGQLPGLGLPRATRLPILAALHARFEPVPSCSSLIALTMRCLCLMSWDFGSSRRAIILRSRIRYSMNKLRGVWQRGASVCKLSLLYLNIICHLRQKPETPPIFVTSVRSLMTRTLPSTGFPQGM